MRTLYNLLVLFVTWVVCVAAIGFTAGVSYGVFKPFFQMGAALLGT